jgi:hypothetical protein
LSSLEEAAESQSSRWGCAISGDSIDEPPERCANKERVAPHPQSALRRADEFERSELITAGDDVVVSHRQRIVSDDRDAKEFSRAGLVSASGAPATGAVDDDAIRLKLSFSSGNGLCGERHHENQGARGPSRERSRESSGVVTGGGYVTGSRREGAEGGVRGRGRKHGRKKRSSKADAAAMYQRYRARNAAVAGTTRAPAESSDEED